MLETIVCPVPDFRYMPDNLHPCYTVHCKYNNTLGADAPPPPPPPFVELTDVSVESARHRLPFGAVLVLLLRSLRWLPVDDIRDSNLDYKKHLFEWSELS